MSGSLHFIPVLAGSIASADMAPTALPRFAAAAICVSISHMSIACYAMPILIIKFHGHPYADRLHGQRRNGPNRPAEVCSRSHCVLRGLVMPLKQ